MLDERWKQNLEMRGATARVVRGSPAQVAGVLARVQSSARSELQVLGDPARATACGVPDDVLRRSVATMSAMTHRGVQVRMVTTTVGRTSLRDRAGALPCSSLRTVEQLPLTAQVLDRRLAILPLDLAVLNRGFSATSDPAVVTLVLAIHERLWSSGAEPAAADAPPDHLAAVVTALATHSSDAAAARRLGLSMRTFSRRVAELMDVLGAGSRFAAGFEAHRRGWT